MLLGELKKWIVNLWSEVKTGSSHLLANRAAAICNHYHSFSCVWGNTRGWHRIENPPTPALGSKASCKQRAFRPLDSGIPRCRGPPFPQFWRFLGVGDPYVLGSKDSKEQRTILGWGSSKSYKYGALLLLVPRSRKCTLPWFLNVGNSPSGSEGLGGRGSSSLEFQQE